jgi:hypothetical protein
VKDLPDGPLCPGNGDRLYQQYNTVEHQAKTRAAKAGILAGFRPHSLRHAFASVMLARGIPITDVAQWPGHKDINETYRTYRHLVPNAVGRAVLRSMPSRRNGAARHKNLTYNRIGLIMFQPIMFTIKGSCLRSTSVHCSCGKANVLPAILLSCKSSKEWASGSIRKEH